jgi:two-component system, LytTR family, response regulator
MRVIKTLLAATDAGGLSQLQSCAEREPGLAVVGTVVNPSARTAASAINSIAPELVFLDLGDASGAAARLIGDRVAGGGPAVVVVTSEEAMRRWTPSAFDEVGVDLLVKPVTRERFQQAVRKAGDRIGMVVSRYGNHAGDRSQTGDHRSRPHLNRMIARQGGRMIVVDLDTIQYIQAAANYLSLYAGSQTYTVRMKIGDLAEQLDPERFARVHRSTIVNMRYARAFRATGSRTYSITLDNGVEVRMSNTYSRQILSSYFIAPGRFRIEQHGSAGQ